MALLSSACTAPPETDADARIDALRTELESRFTPGLHTLMMHVGDRHGSLWFAGEAENWPLAAYMLHELDELLVEAGALHPAYDGIPVAQLITSMTDPALEWASAAVDSGDAPGFVRAFDELTAACNACHVASDRAVLRIQRPTSPAHTNLRYRP